MYSRVTQFKGNPEKLAELEARVDGIKDHMSGVDGMIASYACWNGDASGVTMTVYESEEAANAATPHVQQIWAGLADLLIAPPEISSYATVEKMA